MRVAARVIFDLGLVRSLGYYTGAVFQVYDPAYGVPIGSGGRYDELLAQFGRPMPAVGFALNIERVDTGRLYHLAVAEQLQCHRSITQHCRAQQVDGAVECGTRRLVLMEEVAAQ